MSAARWIESRGVRVRAEGVALTLEGLAGIPSELAAEVLAFARQNKAQLLEELGEPPGLPTRPCVGCGKPFTPSHESMVYCRAWCFNHVRVLQ